MPSDPKPRKRIKDPALLRGWHLMVRTCALADDTCENDVTAHHVHKHPRDDVSANLAPLCGDGARGHHGQIEAHEPRTCRRFYDYLQTRADTLDYLAEKLRPVGGSFADGEKARDEWLRRLLRS